MKKTEEKIRLAVVKQTETLAIRATIPYADVGQQLNLLWQEMGHHVAAHRIKTTGSPYCRYHSLLASTVDVECGFPVTGFAPEAGRVQRSSLPASKCVTAIHEGGYETLSETYQMMLGWIGSEDLAPAQGRWEFYLIGPLQEKDPTKWRTQVFWPVEGGGSSHMQH